MKKKIISILVCVTVVGKILTGCSGNPISTKMPVDSLENSADIIEEDLVHIGFSQLGAESDWRIANTVSMKDALSEENGYKLIFDDAKQEQKKQIKAVRDFISKGVDVIVIAPVTETGWEAVLIEARDAGIPVIIVDRMIDVTDDTLYTCWVGSDFEEEGVKAANWLVNYMDEQGRSDEEHNIVVLQGTIGSSAEIGRTKGFSDTIAANRNYKILKQQTGEFTQAKGREVMESFMEEYDDINVVITQNDNMAFGVIEALKAAGKAPGSEVVIVSFDAVKAAFESMIEGDMNVSVECNPLHGPRVAELVDKIMKGEEVEKIQYVEEGVYAADTAKEDLLNRQY